jgi:PadR family transcriptional regulator, regulatory protein AphA
MELSPTAYVILGFLSWRPMSGYDIKSLVDESTRFFWAASYGQIYPELRRLADAGLIEAAEAAEGGRRRQEYALTADGREALEGWLANEPDVFELRDEGLLKLFFASASPETAVETLVAKRAQHAETLSRFRELEASGKPTGFALQTLRYGIEMQQWCVSWCDRAIADLDPARKAA